MARGAYRGVGAVLDGLQPISGGQWNASGQGRVTSDEFHAFGYPNNVPSAGHGAAGTYPGARRLVRFPRQLEIFFPGNAGTINNVGCGRYMVQDVAPFSAAYNAAGAFDFVLNSTANYSILENNMVFQSAAAINLPICSTVVASPLYLGNVAGTTMTETVNEVSSSTNFAGTLTATRLNNFQAFANALNGAVITARAGYHVADTAVSGGGVQPLTIGLDVDPLIVATNSVGVQLFATGATYTNSYPIGLSINPGVGATLNFANATFGTLINIAGTFLYNQNGAALGSGTVMAFTSTIKNVTATSSTVGLTTGFSYSPTFQADTHAIAMNTAIGFVASPVTNVISGGTLTYTALTNYRSTANVGASTTVSTLTHFQFVDAAHAGTITLQVGIDLPTLAAATTNIGIRLGGMLNPLQISQTATGPTVGNLTSNTNAVFTVYFGGTNYYFLIAWNDGGTVRYKYLPLTGTTATWATGTTLPT